MPRSSARRSYFVLASVLYIALGGVILARSVMGHVLPVAVLGIIFIALGAVRLRDFRSARP